MKAAVVVIGVVLAAVAGGFWLQSGSVDPSVSERERFVGVWSLHTDAPCTRQMVLREDGTGTVSDSELRGGPVSVPPDFYLSKGFAFTWIRNFSGTYSKDGISCDTGASDPPGQPQIYWDEYWIMHFC